MRVRRVQETHTVDDFRREWANLNPRVPFFLDAGPYNRDFKAGTGDQAARFVQLLKSGVPMLKAMDIAYGKRKCVEPCAVETLDAYIRFIAALDGPRPRLLVEVDAPDWAENRDAWSRVHADRGLNGHLTVVSAGEGWLHDGLRNAHALIVYFDPSHLPDLDTCEVEDCYLFAWDNWYKYPVKAKAFINSDAGSGWRYTDINHTLNEVTEDDLQQALQASTV